MSFSKHKLKYFLILFFGFISQESFAQITISGKILDEQQKGIEFANVFLKQKDSTSIVNSEISNQEGRFKIETRQNGNFNLVISFIGYKDWVKQDINQSIDLGEITLIPTDHVLGEVTVTAERAIIEKKEDKLVFNVASSPLKQNYDGMEVLERSPNIVVNGENILIRNEAVTLMINGRALNLSGADLANYIRNIKSEDIKNIEIQTHLSANIDAESSGGVVNIILKKKPIGFDGNIRAEYAFRGQGDYTNSPSVNFNYGAEKWNIYGAYRYLDIQRESKFESNIVYYDTQDLLLENGSWKSLRKRHNYQLGFVADAIKDHVFGIEFFATNFHNQFHNQNLITLLNNGDLLDEGSANLNGDTNVDLYNLTVNYSWTVDTLGSSLKVFADYAHQNVLGKNKAVSLYEKGLYEDNSERNNSSSNTAIYSVQADLAKYFKQDYKLEAGAKITYTQRENDLQSDFLVNQEWILSDRSTSFQYDEQVLAGYVSLSKNIKEKNFIKLGLRMENTSLERMDLMKKDVIHQNYTNWLPSVYFSRELSEKNTISLSYSKRLRRPPFYRINNNVIKINDFRFELGNPDLTPEYVHRFELSFKQKKQTLAAYYHKTVDAINGIYFLENQIAFYKPFNAGSQTQFGLDYNRFNDLNKWWYLNASLGIYQRKFTNEENIDSFKRITGRINCTNVFKLNETTKLDISGHYQSPLEDAFYIAFETYSLSLMLQKQFLDKKLNCRLYFNDIFNTLVYESERPFATFKSFNSLKPQTRRIRLWISYSFSSRNKVNKRTNQSQNEARRRL